MENRFFSVEEFLKNPPEKATKFLLYQNERTNGVIWYVPVGDEVPAHYHPETDDVWIMLSGEGDYYLGKGETRHVTEGMIIPAEKNDIHGIRATGTRPLIFTAVSAPMPVEMIKE